MKDMKKKVSKKIPHHPGRISLAFPHVLILLLFSILLQKS